jgi:hypothetical protein
MYGQELNAESYAICKADMLIKGQDISNIIHGNTLSNDGLIGKQFDYMLSNPPFGVEWKKIQKTIEKEHEGAGLRRSLWSGPAASQRRFAAVPDASDFQDATGERRRKSIWHRPERIALFTGNAGAAKVRSAAMCWKTICWKPSSDYRPTCSTTRASAPTSGSDQSQAGTPQGQGAVDRRQRHVAEDAKESGQQTEGTEPRTHRRDHSNLFGDARKSR